MDDFAFSRRRTILRTLRRCGPWERDAGVPLVAVFEDDSLCGLSEAATTYAVPYEWRTEYGIRRYGFHGASHRSASERVKAAMAAAGLRHISCHLAGVRALRVPRWRDGGYELWDGPPQSGLPQNNRVGDIDAFACCT